MGQRRRSRSEPGQATRLRVNVLATVAVLQCGRGSMRTASGLVAKWVVVSLDHVADIEVLDGGIADAGAVVRDGDHVLRPSSVHTPTIHAFLAFCAMRALRPPVGRSGSMLQRCERLLVHPGRRCCPAVPGVGRERHGPGDGGRAAPPHA